jgi:hypothetical protein
MKAVALICLTAVLLAASAVDIQEGSVVCVRQTWLDDMRDFFEKRDRNSLMSYIDMGRCFIGGKQTAQLIRQDGNTAELLFRGKRLWIDSRAISVY